MPTSDGEDVWSVHECLRHVDTSENKRLNVLRTTKATPSESDPGGSLSPSSINGSPEFVIPLCSEGYDVKEGGGYIREPTATALINLDQLQQRDTNEENASLYIFNEDSDDINALPEMSLSELTSSENHMPQTSIGTDSDSCHLDRSKPGLSMDQSYIQHPQF